MAQAYYNTSSTGTNFVALTSDMVGAAAASHTHSYLPLAGGTMNGPIHFNSNSMKSSTNGSYICCIDGFADGGELKYISGSNLRTAIGAAASSHTHSYLPLSGGTLTGAVTHNAKNNRYSCSGGSWVNGKTASNVPIVFSTASTKDGSRYDPYMWGQNTDGDVWNFGAGANNEICFCGFAANRTANGTDWKWGINIETGMLTDPEVCIQSSQPTNKNARLWVKI